MFANIEGNPPDVIENPDEIKEYRITVIFKKNSQYVIEGSFDRKGLPEDWPEFAEDIFDLMNFYGFGEIVDPTIYEKSKRCVNDYMFCSVEFDEGSKNYYYLSDDDTIKIGDLVSVTAGKDAHISIVKVVDIEYFSKEDAPFPIEKIKHIVRKCNENDIKGTNFN